MTDLLKILSPIAVVAFIWSVIQFFIKRKYEKKDKKKEFAIKILTDFLTEINDIRILSTEIFNHFERRTKKLNGVLLKYRNHKVVNQFADKEIDSHELILTFKNLSISEQKEYLEKSKEFFETGNETDAELVTFLKEKNKELENKALSLNRIPLLNLVGSKELITKRKNIIDIMDDVLLLDYLEDSKDVSQYFHQRMQILQLSFELEYLVLAEIKKTVANI